jgi:Kef-type K+ transport system membrane component KefB
VIARAGALLLLIALMLLLQAAPEPTPATGLRTVGLALGFALVAATLLSDLADRLRLPRLTGYLVFGLACGPYVASLLTPVMARQLQVVNGLAITLIALVAGLEINVTRLRSRLVPMLKFTGVTVGVSLAALFVLFLAAWPLLPLAPQATLMERLAFSGLVAMLVVSYSPTVTIATIAESRARGPLAELVLTVVVLADLTLIFVFALAMQFARTVSEMLPIEDVSLLSRLLWEVVGSLAFGALLGSLFALYLRFVGREVTIVLLGLCLLITSTASALHFEALLVALAAGLVVENIAPPRGDALRDAVERGALPILVVFFVAAGANLDLEALAQIGGMAVIIAVVRAIVIRLGTQAAQRVAQLDSSVASKAWTGLIAQAGVTFGLAAMVATEFPEWGPRVQTLVVALGALHVLAGPMLFRSALAQAGEIGRQDEADIESGHLVIESVDSLSH